MDFYLCKVAFEGEFDRNGNPKLVKKQYIVECDSTFEAETKMAGFLKDSATDYEILSVVKTPIVELIK